MAEQQKRWRLDIDGQNGEAIEWTFEGEDLIRFELQQLARARPQEEWKIVFRYVWDGARLVAEQYAKEQVKPLNREEKPVDTTDVWTIYTSCSRDLFLDGPWEERIRRYFDG